MSRIQKHTKFSLKCSSCSSFPRPPRRPRASFLFPLATRLGTLSRSLRYLSAIFLSNRDNSSSSPVPFSRTPRASSVFFPPSILLFSFVYSVCTLTRFNSRLHLSHPQIPLIPLSRVTPYPSSPLPCTRARPV